VDIPIAGLSTSAALVLPAGAQLRFVANADWNGTPGALTAHLSDGTGFVAGASVDISGATGGTNGWSATPITIATSVTAVNDAPTRADAVPVVLAAIAEDAANPPGDTVANLFGPKFVDAADQIVGGSSANTLAGIAITANAADPATQGRWQYTIDGGTTWTDVGVVSAAGALLLPDSASLRFVPVADFNGTPGALSVRLVDSSGGAVAGASTVDVSGANSGGITRYAGAADAISLGTSVGAVNDAPLASAQATTILEDGFRQFAAADFAAAFSDVDGDALAAIRIDALPARGALTLGGVAVAPGQVIAVADIVDLRYTPAADENGAAYARFDFSVSDGAAFSAAPAAYTINVTPVNDAPALSADLTFPTLTEDIVPAGRTLAQLVASTGATVSDVDAGASLAGFAITGNTALPAQGRWQYSSDSANWFDIGSVADGSPLVLAPATQVRFVPAADFSGTPGSLALRVLDDTYAGGFASTAGGIETRVAIDATVNGGTTAIAAIPRALATTVAPVTDPPNLTANPASGNEDTTIPLGIAASLNDTDGSETLSITIAGIPAGSRLSNAAGDALVPVAGTITLTPAQLAGLAVRPPLNFNGAVTLAVTATSVDGPDAPVSITAPLVLTVIPNNDPPVAADDAITTAEDTPAVIPVLANDSDIEDGVPAITAVNGIAPVGGIITATTANGGTITVNVATGEMRYTPAANWNGVDTFAYTVTDTDGVSDAATVTVNVTAVNDAPNPAPDVAATIEDTAVLIDLLANDTDIEGDALALSAIDGQPIAVGQSVAVAHGTVTLNANGTVTFTPAPDYSGPATFRYTATDRNGGFAESVANISVAPVTDVPALGVAPASGVLGTPVPLPIQAGSTDSDGSETVTVTLVGLPDGSVLINGAGETFVVSGGAVSLPSTALPGLAVSLPPTFSGVATVQVTATARDGSAAPVSRTAAFELRAEPPPPSEPASPLARGADPYLLYPGIELDAIILRRGFVPAEHVLNAVAESRFERARLAGDILDTVDAADVGAVRATLLGGGYLADQPRTVAGAIAEAKTDLRETRVRAAGAANPLTRGAATLADDFEAFAPAPIGRAMSGAHGDRPAPGEVRKEAAESATTPVSDAGRPQASSAATAPARAAQAFSEQLHQAAAERAARQLPPPAVAERRPR
jgi:predicted secreted protein